jgi:hypothetical protein
MPRTFHSFAVSAAIVAIAVFPGALAAQDPAGLLLPVPTSHDAIGFQFGRATPGVSTSSPLAFGPSLGDLFGGGGYQARIRYANSDDASFSMGFGLGDSNDGIGVEVVLTALSTYRSGVGKRMVTSYKVHRMLPQDMAIAVGIEGVTLTGGNKIETEPSLYAAVSKFVPIRIEGVPQGYLSSLTLNVGAGNGRFCGEQMRNGRPDGLSNCRANVFGSAALRATEWASIIGDWTGQDLNVAVSLVPFKKFPIVITPGFADVTEHAGDGARFTVGLGLSIKY